MFTIHQTPQTHHQKYTPYYPSPLSSSPLRSSPIRSHNFNSSPLRERCANLLTPSISDSAMMQAKIEDEIMSSPTRCSKHLLHDNSQDDVTISLPELKPIPQIQHQKSRPRKNPLLDRTKEMRAETRRKLFLSNVAKKRDDEKWQRRNGGDGEDELMRVLWSGERAREIAKLQSEAESSLKEEEEDEAFDGMQDGIVAEVDDVAEWERAELEALVGARDDENERRMHARRDGGEDSIYGSDDEEYDSIFQDVFEEEMRMSQSQPQQQQDAGDQDMMDLS